MNRVLITAISVGAAAVASHALRERQRNVIAARATRENDIGAVTQKFLLYFIVPVWTVAGVADWACHHRTDIEKTTGTKETLIHLLTLGEVGVPVLAGLFLEINPAVLALMISAFFVHEVTALWDVSYAVTRRKVTPIEQHAHSFLEILPLMAVSFISILHWPRFMELLGFAGNRDMVLRLKRRPLAIGYTVANLSGILLLELLPYMNELWRDWRANPWRLMPPERQRRNEE